MTENTLSPQAMQQNVVAHTPAGHGTPVEHVGEAAERQRAAKEVTHHDEHGHDGHGHHGVLHHHFEDMGQQRESITLGMWAFLTTEVMMFGALIFSYTLYRFYFYPAFVAGSHNLDILLGTVNTFVLLFSSLTMAMAVHYAQLRDRKWMVRWMVATLLLGLVFVGIKAKEWTHDYQIGLVPAVHWRPEMAAAYHEAKDKGEDPHAALHHFEERDASRVNPYALPGSEGALNAYDARQNPHAAADKYFSNSTRANSVAGMNNNNVGDTRLINTDNMQMYFVLYFCMTGLHAIHMVIGMVILCVFIYLGQKGQFTNGNDQPVELFGLYWHFVDIVWIFLFPLLYLIGGK